MIEEVTGYLSLLIAVISAINAFWFLMKYVRDKRRIHALAAFMFSVWAILSITPETIPPIVELFIQVVILLFLGWVSLANMRGKT